MLPQRAAQQMLRRIAVQQPAYRFVAPAALASQNALLGQRRLAASAAPPSVSETPSGFISEAEATNQILAKQRLHRPVSPHLGIYQPQITWYGSILNRITGSIMSGGFYIFGALYLVAPYVGLHLESAVLAAGFAKWPAVLKVLTKSVVAWPFTYHSLNGVRHLFWDMTSLMQNKQVNQTGWAVVGLSIASAVGLAFL